MSDFDAMRKAELAQDGSMKATDAAAFIGISPRRLYELREAGVITYSVIGGKIVFPRKALVEYLAAQMKIGSVA